MFASASVDLKLHTFTSEGVEDVQIQYPPSTSKILNISICNDNSYMALLRENEKPQILAIKDLQNVRLIHTINVSNISAITFKRNTKKHIALGTKLGEVIMYDTKSRTVSNVYSKVTNEVKALAFTCDDQQLCGIDGTTFFVFTDIAKDKNLKRFKQAAECCYIRSHAFIPNRIALGYITGAVAIWDVAEAIELITLDLLPSPVTGIAMSSCGNFLVAAGKYLKICSVDLTTCSSLFQYTLDQPAAVTSVDLSPDDKLLAVGLTDGTLKIFDVKENLKEISSTKVHDSAVNLVVFDNQAKEINSNFSSVMKLTEQESKEPETFENVFQAESSKKSGKAHKDESLDKLKRHLLKVMKNEMDSLENQLQEHCVKFQKFLDNEFETIDDIIKKKWNIFNEGDMNQIVKAICHDDSKNCS